MVDATVPERGPEPSDDPVIAYLAALEARRAAPETLPQPDQSGEALATGAMVHGSAGEEDPPDTEQGAHLTAQLSEQTPGSEENLQLLEDAFVAAAADYGRRHEIGYQGWIEAGVDPAVLERAGIPPEGG
jgi:hypothetical protein